ncbi:hypothetical protein A9Q77_08090 [Marinomonas sp. 42_23_T18]|nr:hypothetical protein A9Q77_08090 [Marinomonas sp. 42_23_T18]
MDRHEEKLLKALSYIESHLETPLSTESISAHVGLSQSHFHRLFSVRFGLSLYDLIMQLRLKRAAYQLAYRQDKVIDIALGAHYQSPEAFSRAFLKVFKQSPRAFRKSPDWSAWHKKDNDLLAKRNAKMLSKQTYKVELVNCESIQIAYIEHRGNANQLGLTIQAFIAWRKARGLSPSKSRTFNLIYHDPQTVPPDEYRFDIACVFLDTMLGPFDLTSKMKLRTIPAGRYAKIRHHGSDDDLGLAINYLYSQWLNESHRTLRDFPLFVERVRFFPDVAEHQAITDIYLAIE